MQKGSEQRGGSIIWILECQLLNISTSVWMLHTPNTGRNLHFQHFLCKKAEKNPKLAYGSIHLYITTSILYSYVVWTWTKLVLLQNNLFKKCKYQETTCLVELKNI